ncbi:NUDIX hydrolase [bacterium]|nr:MAG: NUDIX hydrolase [bacterium]
MSNKFELIQKRLVYENKWIEVYDDIVSCPNGCNGTYIRIKYHDNPVGVVVLPRLPDGRMLLIRVNRYATGGSFWEFPRGGGRKDELPEVSANRELTEETTLVAEKFEHLGFQYPDNAIVMTMVAVFIAHLPTDAEKLLYVKSDEAIIEGKFLNFNEIISMVRQGTITDGFTLSALALYQALMPNSSNAY